MYAAVWPHSERRCVWPFDRVATTSGGCCHSSLLMSLLLLLLLILLSFSSFTLKCVWPFDRVATTSGGRRHSFADLASGTRWKVRVWWTSNNVFCPEESEAGAHFCKTHLWLCRLVWRYVEREKRQCTFVFNFKRISWLCLRSKLNICIWRRWKKRTHM